MKKRAVGILVGVMVSSMLLSACGSNEAKEAASESAQVEEEGTGERKSRDYRGRAERYCPKQ